MENKRILKMTTQISDNMLNILKDEDDRIPIDLIEIDDDNVTDFFTASLLASMHIFQGITGTKTDLIGFIHILNKLAVQFLMEERAESIESID